MKGKKTETSAVTSSADSPESSEQIKDANRKVAPRLSSVRLSKVSTLSVTLHAFFVYTVVALSLLLATTIAWFAFDKAGIFVKIVNTIAPTGNGADKLYEWLSLSSVMTVVVLGLVALVVILTVVTGFVVMVFNIVSKLSGGVRIQLSN